MIPAVPPGLEPGLDRMHIQLIAVQDEKAADLPQGQFARPSTSMLARKVHVTELEISREDRSRC